MLGNPLENHKAWKNIIYKKTGETAIRETDTLDTFVDPLGIFKILFTAEKNKPLI